MRFQRLFKFSLLVFLLIFLTATPALAEGDVLGTIKDRAVTLMKSLKPLIFVLAGFGLIGFAYGAIFNQLSWKWFCNIAIGLFLVANMGLLVDTMTKGLGSGGGSNLKADLGEQYKITYGNRSGGRYKGSYHKPKKQKTKNGEGTAGAGTSNAVNSFKEIKPISIVGNNGVTPDAFATGNSVGIELKSNSNGSDNSAASGYKPIQILDDLGANANTYFSNSDFGANQNGATAGSDSNDADNSATKAKESIIENGTEFLQDNYNKAFNSENEKAQIVNVGSKFLQDNYDSTIKGQDAKDDITRAGSKLFQDNYNEMNDELNNN